MNPVEDILRAKRRRQRQRRWEEMQQGYEHDVLDWVSIGCVMIAIGCFILIAAFAK